MTDSHWTFFSNYAHVLVCLAETPEATLREIADRVGITERSAMRLITNLDDAGILRRVKQGLSLIHISEPTRLGMLSRMPSSA